MTQPDPANTGVKAEDVIAELEGQLGQALGQNARLVVALRARQQDVVFLREQLAARDADPEAGADGPDAGRPG